MIYVTPFRTQSSVSNLMKKNTKVSNSENNNSYPVKTNSGNINFGRIHEPLYPPRMFLTTKYMNPENIVLDSIYALSQDFPVPNKLLEKTKKVFSKFLVSSKDISPCYMYDEKNKSAQNDEVVFNLQKVSNAAIYDTFKILTKPVQDKSVREIINEYYGKNAYQKIKAEAESRGGYTIKDKVSDYIRVNENKNILVPISEGRFADAMEYYGTYLNDITNPQDENEYGINVTRSLPSYRGNTQEKFNNYMLGVVFDAILYGQNKKTLANTFTREFSTELDKFEHKENLKDVKYTNSEPFKVYIS